MDLSISNVVNVSVSEAGAGAGEYNTSNIGLFTSEEPANSYGTDGYKIYVEPTEVATDFGSNSIAYAMALAIFSQQPNILANNGYLTVMKTTPEIRFLEMSATPDAGSYKVVFRGNSSVLINFDDADDVIIAKVKAIPGLENVKIVVDPSKSLFITMSPYIGNTQYAITISDNTLEATAIPVTIDNLSEQVGEPLKDALIRTKPLVQYFGVITTDETYSQAELISDIGPQITSDHKIMGTVSNLLVDVDAAGKFDSVRLASLDQLRCLFYGGTQKEALVMLASYFGRGLSTNFSGTNTTQTMHLKDLIGVLPDDTVTQTVLNKCQDAGVDIYVSIRGVPKVFTSGANNFFDRVYNRLWIVGAIEVAGFNVLAQSSTKIPQTENGVDSLKSAYRLVCEQAVANQYVAPGRWTSPSTFGVQEDFYNNISERGYYIYSRPIGLQLPSDRNDRKAPLIQLAIKEAGAIHSSTLIININA